MPSIMAHCPLCTAATIVGVGVTRSLGWDDSIVGVFVGTVEVGVGVGVCVAVAVGVAVGCAVGVGVLPAAGEAYESVEVARPRS